MNVLQFSRGAQPTVANAPCKGRWVTTVNGYVFPGLSESTPETSYKNIVSENHNRDDFQLVDVDYDEYDAQVFKLPNKSLTQ